MKEYRVYGRVTFEVDEWFDAPCDISQDELLDMAADCLFDAPLQGLADVEVDTIEEVKEDE